MILSAQTIRSIRPIEPFCEREVHRGMSYGLGAAGYDVRVAEDHLVGVFALASTMERFSMPDDVLAVVHDKSTWARRGLFVQNTVIEPGWRGYLTLELTCVSGAIRVYAGDPIAQIVFHQLDEPTIRPYSGKYQDQKAGPQPAR